MVDDGLRVIGDHLDGNVLRRVRVAGLGALEALAFALVAEDVEADFFEPVPRVDPRPAPTGRAGNEAVALFEFAGLHAPDSIRTSRGAQVTLVQVC